MENTCYIYKSFLYPEYDYTVHIIQDRLPTPYAQQIHIFAFRKLKRILFQPIIDTAKEMYSCLSVFQSVYLMIYKIIQKFFRFFRNDQFISHIVLS